MPTHNSLERKDEREERFGNALYGALWIVLSDDELRHIKNVHDAADVSQERMETVPCHPLRGSWSNYHLPLLVHFGPPAEVEDARKAHVRFLARKDQLKRIRKMLRLLDRYGVDFDPLERVHSDDDRAELDKVRDLCRSIKRERSEAQSMFSNAAKSTPSPFVLPLPLAESISSGWAKSAQDEWDAALKRMGKHPLGDGVKLFIRPGLGLNGLYWESTPGALSAHEWRELQAKALATEHAALDIAVLDRPMIGDAFVSFVIKDPKVQACLSWLRFECRALRSVLVGAYPDGSPNNKRQWPVRLEAGELANIFSRSFEAPANYQDDLTKGPIYHAAKALADRNKMFYDLFRGHQSELIADGIYRATGLDSEVSEKQWSLPGRWLDIESSNLIDRTGGGAGDVLYEGLSLRRRSAMPTPSPAASEVSLNRPASEVNKSRKRGRPEHYDFPKLRKDTEAYVSENGGFLIRENWIKWCLEPGRVKLRPGMMPPTGKRKGDPPDLHTLEDGIKRHSLDKIPGLFRDGQSG